MFPTFPYLTESIAAERAADLRREAAAYRRTRGIRRPLVRTSHAGARPHARRSPVAARTVPQPGSCDGARVS